MPGPVSRRQLLRLAGTTVAGVALAHQPVLAETPNQPSALQAQPGIEPNTVRRRGTGRIG